MRNSLRAYPRSRNELRGMAQELRKILGIQEQLYVNVIALLEHVLPKIKVNGKELNYEIVPDSSLSEMAKTYPEEGHIVIKESVYCGAVRGCYVSRFTIMHEIAHYLLHKNQAISFARRFGEIKTYEDPEWQADAFAGEFLMPSNLIKGLSPGEISKR